MPEPRSTALSDSISPPTWSRGRSVPPRRNAEPTTRSRVLASHATLEAALPDTTTSPGVTHLSLNGVGFGRRLPTLTHEFYMGLFNATGTT